MPDRVSACGGCIIHFVSIFFLLFFSYLSSTSYPTGTALLRASWSHPATHLTPSPGHLTPSRGRCSCRRSTNSGRRQVVDPDLDGLPSVRSSSAGLTADLWRRPPDELTDLDEERPQGCEESEAVKDDHRDRGAGRGRLLVPGSRVVFGAGRLTILMGLICSNFGSRCRGTSLCHKPKSRPASRH